MIQLTKLSFIKKTNDIQRCLNKEQRPRLVWYNKFQFRSLFNLWISRITKNAIFQQHSTTRKALQSHNRTAITFQTNQQLLKTKYLLIITKCRQLSKYMHTFKYCLLKHATIPNKNSETRHHLTNTTSTRRISKLLLTSSHNMLYGPSTGWSHEQNELIADHLTNDL